MQNTIPPEWLAIISTIGTIIGTVILGLFYSRRPPAAADTSQVHAAGFLFDPKTMKDLVEAISALRVAIKEGLEEVSSAVYDRRERNSQERTQELLAEMITMLRGKL